MSAAVHGETGALKEILEVSDLNAQDEDGWTALMFAACAGHPSSVAALLDAGADAIFPEALQGWEEYEKVREAIDVPLLANLTEFGKTPLLNKTELEELGYNIAIYPVTSLRLSMKAVEDGFAAIKHQGTQKEIVDRMQTRARLYELINYEDYNKFDKDIFNFGTDGHGGE